MVTVDDVAFETRIRYAGPALQILGKGQRHLVNIGQVFIMVVTAAGVVGHLVKIPEIIMKAVLFEDRTNAQHIAQQPLLPGFEPQHAAVPRRSFRGAHGRHHCRQRRADQKLIYFFVMHCDIHRD